MMGAFYLRVHILLPHLPENKKQTHLLVGRKFLGRNRAFKFPLF